MSSSVTVLKRSFKGLIYILVAVTGFYFVFMFAFGGYGKDPVTLTLPQYNGGRLLFAHRAMSIYFPEGSMKAVEEAQLHGLNGVELDIQKDKNGELMVFHDETCDRLLGFKGLIDTMPLADIKKHPLIFGEKTVSSSYVMSVKELLDCHPYDLVYYFDMKLSDFKTADDMVNMVRKYGIEKNCVIANSSAPFIFYIEYNYPEINTALEGFDAGKEWTYYLMPRSLKPDFFSGFSWKTDRSHIDWLKKKDLLDCRIVYGVELGNLSTMMNYGLKNLILDYDTAMAPITGIQEPQSLAEIFVTGTD